MICMQSRGDAGSIVAGSQRDRLRTRCRENADRAGAYLCAKAGFNPWGMVWGLRQHSEAMGDSYSGGSDHPSDEQREAALVALFHSHRATFGRFSDDVASATLLAQPQRVAQRYYSQYRSYPQYAQPYSQYPPYPPPPPPPCYPDC